MMTKHKLSVFLCHASQDSPVVDHLYDRLLAQAWIDPWLDRERLLPGQDWNMEIEKAVEKADAVIVCLSNNSITKTGYVQKELRFVLDIADEKPDEEIFVIPIRLDECSVPKRLRKWQYVDYFPSKQESQSFYQLLQALITRAESLDIPTSGENLQTSSTRARSSAALTGRENEQEETLMEERYRGTATSRSARKYLGSATREDAKRNEHVIEQDKEVVSGYLDKVIEDNKRFNFRGLETIGGVKIPEFDNAYVSLGLAFKSTEKTDPFEDSAELIMSGQPEILDIGSAFQRSHKLAVIGTAGSGKSTLLQWVNLSLARQYLKLENELSSEQRQFCLQMGSVPLVPIQVALREFNHYCINNKFSYTAKALVDFIRVQFSENHPLYEIPEDFFRKQIKQGCLLMFDGLDEVDYENRASVSNAVEMLVKDSGIDRNYYLLTSRPVAYEGRTEIAGFFRCEIQPLTPSQRDILIRYWCKSVYQSTDKAIIEAQELSRQIAKSDYRIRELARTPLMVSILALVKYSKKQLPNQRAELYDWAVNVLVSRPYSVSVDVWNDVTFETRRDRLARIAYELHTINSDGLAEDELLDRIWNEFGSDEKLARRDARKFLRWAADRSGLLEGDKSKYGFFTHRSFREYLAGYYLAEQLEDSWHDDLQKHLSDDQWEEVIRLAAGSLASSNRRRADKFIRQLLELGKKKDLRIQERACALIWAARALSDFPFDRLSIETRDELAQNMLLMLTTHPPIIGDLILRRRLGLALAAIGDPRFGHTLLRDHSTKAKALFAGFVDIPAGSFRMGSGESETALLKEQRASIGRDASPAHIVFVSSFAIGKYEVTNSEFRVFIEEMGYDNQAFWSEEGWSWRTGEMDTNLSFLSDEEIRRGYELYLTHRPRDKRSQPFLWDEPAWNAENCPVVGINWYEANAYCRWLTANLISAKLMPGDQIIRLPTEAEWEKAAKTGSMLWPWGNSWDRLKSNSVESQIRGTTPVGMFPDGSSSETGLMDMVGNVWEWCIDWYDEDLYTTRVNSEATDPFGPSEGFSRVLRGGSWRENRFSCLTTRRRRNFPIFFGYDVGFRLVWAPENNNSEIR